MTVAVPLVDGRASYSLTNLFIGEYLIEYSYNGTKYKVESDYEYLDIYPDIQFHFTKNDYENRYIFVNDTAGVSIAAPSTPKGEFNVTLRMIVGSELDEWGDSVSVFETVDSVVLPLSDGKANYNISGLKLGRYCLWAEYLVDGGIVTKTGRYFDVIPLDFSVTDVVVPGVKGNVTMVLPGDATGELKVAIFRETYDYGLEDWNLEPFANLTGSFKDGRAVVMLPEFPYVDGSYHVESLYVGNYGIYRNIDHVFTSLNITIDGPDKYDSNGENVFTFKSNLTGNLTVFIDDEPYQEVIVSDGNANIVLPNNLTQGSHEIHFKFESDDGKTYNTYAQLNVDNLLDCEMNVQSNAPSAGQDLIFEVNLPKFATGTVSVTIGERTENSTVSSGKATVTFSNLAAGDYNATVYYGGDSRYGSATNTTSAVVKANPKPSTSIAIDVSDIVTGKDAVINIKFANDITASVSLKVGSNNYAVDVVNGKASKTISGLAAGTYDVVVKFNGNDAYEPAEKSASFKVSEAKAEVQPKVVAGSSSILYAGKYSVTVYGKDGKVAKNTNVVFYVNGKKVKTVKTNSKGVATFALPSKYLPGKKYTIKATALGKTASKKVTVKQVLAIKTVKIKKSGKVVLTATVKKINGKYPTGKITFKFKGRTVKKVSLKNGVAKVTVKKEWYKNLKVGTKVTYTATYLKTTVKKTSKVTK